MAEIVKLNIFRGYRNLNLNILFMCEFLSGICHLSTNKINRKILYQKKIQKYTNIELIQVVRVLLLLNMWLEIRFMVHAY
jgi:hypothetical protein